MADLSLPPVLADSAAREAIAHQLDATLFVEAGAGSGKTTALVARLVALVEAGHDLAAVAAITFTEKAAAELRDRVRVALERAADDPDRRPEVVERCRRAIDALDAAAIGTLHSFAQRLLREHPVEAGLPPVVEVMDEIGSQVAFEERWATFRERLFSEPALERVVLLGFTLQIKLAHLEDIAADFDDDWDLVAERVQRDVPEPPPIDLTALVADARALADLRHSCRSSDDLLCVRLDEIAQWCDQVGSLAGDEVALLEALSGLGGPWNRGRKDNWGATVAAVRDAGAALTAAAAARRQEISDACLRRIGAELARFTLDAAEDRRRHGQLQFHDLLVLARELLRGPHAAAVRATLHRRYEHLLLDEFQDTDPIQIELALRIAAPPDRPAATWAGLRSVPGRLFVVGDPKQSIYRFRRADIGLFLHARDAIGDGDPLQLHANFRTVAPVVEWVNHVFGSLIQPVPDAQPAFQALSAVRSAAPGSAPGPAVAVVGALPHADEPKAEELREREADSVAAAIATILGDGWLVSEPSPDGGPDQWRAARPADIAVLLPARTSLPALQQALDRLGVAHRAESSSLVYATPAIRALLMAAGAIDDPTDELAVVGTLRSSLFGCSDPELFDWVQRRGQWNPLAPLPPARTDRPDPVHDAMTALAQLTRDRAWHPPSELLARLVATRRVLELATEGGQPQDLWRQVRFVIDQARAWSEAGGSGLRAYLHWAARQRNGGARAVEVVLPETDLDAVRIMTIHAAKGLEFPITVVSGLSTKPGGVAGGGRVIWTADGACELKAGSGITTAHYNEAKDLDEQLDHHERLRLLYVACTRARDHLVVSLHRTQAHDGVSGAKATSATLLAHAAEGGTHLALDELGAVHALPPATAVAATDGEWEWADLDAWRAERSRALASSGRRRTIAATTLAQDAVPHDQPADPGLAKDQRDLELPPWQKGRYGTAVGRAVHGVLQTIDLATGDGLEAAATAQAAAEGVADRAGVVEVLARSALQAPAVRAAAAAAHWREVYVAAPLGDTLLEGYIDLLYRDTDGLVVVDYKTDHVPDEPSLEARLQHYRRQGAAYALAIERVTRETVARCVFVFCAPEGARRARGGWPAGRDGRDRCRARA